MPALGGWLVTITHGYLNGRPPIDGIPTRVNVKKNTEREREREGELYLSEKDDSHFSIPEQLS